MRKILLLLLLIPIVSAIEECPRFGVIQQDIPCVQPSTWNPDTCTNYGVQLFNSSGVNVLNATWYAYAPYCAFNITGLTATGTYCYNSTIESGCITLEHEDNMLAITIAIAIIITFFIGLGFINPGIKMKLLSWGLGLIEILVMFSLLYARELGKDITGLMMVNFYALIIIGFGVGMISLILFSLKQVNLEDREDNEKWDGNGKWGR